MSGAQERKLLEANAFGGTKYSAKQTSWSGPAWKGQGTLILIVGPSGSGKDTLINEARKHFIHNSKVIFCERTITRFGDAGERHRSVTKAEFERIAVSNGFFLHWNAHGLRYGIPALMLDALKAGCTVIANVSRRIIPEAQGKWPQTDIINITASRDVLRERLMARGRESAEAIALRLERAFSTDLPCNAFIHQIDNSGALLPAVKQMIAIISGTLSAEEEIG